MAMISMLVATFLLGQGINESDSWAFSPKPDDFSSSAVIDLRSLNEKVAGESGFVTTNAEGDFVLGNGKPARFWALNTGVGRDKNWVKRPLWEGSEPNLERHAKFIAKRGVNLIRLHMQVSPDIEKNPNLPLDSINTSERDAIWKISAAMKKQGIYSCVSPYWGVPMKFAKSQNYPGGTDQSALGLLFFEPKLQAAYKSWLKQLFTEVNPYTGISLAKDPGVAIIQIQNEDSLLFWTVNNLKGPNLELIQSKFFAWATGKYGSSSAAQKAWANTPAPGDAPSSRRFGLLNISELTQNRTGGFGARTADQAQFLSELMYNFNAEIVRYLRTDLGCKQLVNAGNWKTADTVKLNDAERWSYTSADVDAVNHYYTGIHKGPNEGWAIQPGDKITSPSALLNPKALPINIKQTVGRPMMVTESSWTLPIAYISEAPLLVAAYTSLNGVDAYFWFATGEEQWTPPQSANGYMPQSIGKWSCVIPDCVGSFPAAAYLYRKGLVKRGTPAVTETRTLTDLWERRRPIIAEEPSFDPNRDLGDMAPTSTVKTGVDPIAFLVGPVQVGFTKKPGVSKVELGSLIQGPKVTSSTQELTLDSREGLFTMDTPMAQGFSSIGGVRKSRKTSSLQVISENDYFTLIAVSLDDKPIETSSKILLQYVTRSRPSGWKEKPVTISLDQGKTVEGAEIVSVGQAPWRLVKSRALIRVLNKNIKSAMVLDANLNATLPVAIQPVANGITLNFPENALYVVLQATEKRP